MANYRLPEMSLKQVAFQPSEFTPQIFTPQASNPEILSRSIDKLEARIDKATTQQGAIDAALGQVEAQLHSDEETRSWFADYKKDIQHQIQNQIDSGNYAEAIRTGVRLAGKIQQDTELQGRIKTANQYNEVTKAQKQRIGKDIDQDTYNWWLATKGKYNYKPVYAKDENGNTTDQIIDTEDYNPQLAYANLNWDEEISNAFKLTSEDKQASDIGNTAFQKVKDYDQSGNIATNEDGTAKTTGTFVHTRSGSEHISKGEKAIRASLEYSITHNPGKLDQIKQQYDVQRWKLEQLIEQLKTDPNNQELKDEISLKQKLLTKNCVDLVSNPNDIVGLKEFYVRMVSENDQAGRLAFDWHTTSGDTTYTNGYGTGGRGSLTETDTAHPFGQNDIDKTEPGTPVEDDQAGDLENTRRKAGDAGYRIGNRLGYKRTIGGTDETGASITYR